MSKDECIIFIYCGSYKYEEKYFIPYYLYKINKNKNKIFIVATRNKNFNLYKNCKILVRLDNIIGNEKETIGYKTNKLTNNEYLSLIYKICNKYKNDYNIDQIIYPKINNFLYRVPYQFNRSEMVRLYIF